MAGPWMIPAIGAVAGAAMDKENPLRGAALGGMGGYAAGPSGFGLIGSKAAPAIAAGVPGGSLNAIAAGNMTIPGMATGGFGGSLPGALSGLMSGISPSQAMITGGQMMMDKPQQQTPVAAAPPMTAPAQYRGGSLSQIAAQGQPMLGQLRKSSLWG